MELCMTDAFLYKASIFYLCILCFIIVLPSKIKGIVN